MKAGMHKPLVKGASKEMMRPPATSQRFSFEMKPTGDAPFRQQGDARFEDPDVLAGRERLRESKRLQNAALQFWAMTGKRRNETLTFDEYALVHKHICRALAPELTEAEADGAAKEDWAEDADGADRIGFAAYADGLYALADMWSMHVRACPRNRPRPHRG